MYRRTEAAHTFEQARTRTGHSLKGLLDQIVARGMKTLTPRGPLVEERGMPDLADTDADHPLATLQAASCTYRISLGPRAGQNVVSWLTVASRDEKPTNVLCAADHGFGLHTAVGCGADQRPRRERRCRYITHPALAHDRLRRNREGQAGLRLKSPYRDGTTSRTPTSRSGSRPTRGARRRR